MKTVEWCGRVKSAVETSASVAFSMMRYACQHPMRALVFLLSCQTVLAGETKKLFTGPLAKLNQCPLRRQQDDFAIWGHETCSINQQTYRKLLKEYDVVKNVPSFDDVKFYFFGENHNISLHHQLKADFVDALSEPEDSVFFESVTIKFNCYDACISQSFSLMYVAKQTKENSCAVYFNFSPAINCIGWEDPQALSAAQKMLQFCNQQRFISFEKGNECFSSKEYSSTVIKARNRFLQDKMMARKNLPKKTFVFGGAAHFFKCTTNPLVIYPHEVVAEDEPHYELRKALEEVPHALLLPKKR